VLLRPDRDGVIAIGQPAHAWLSGQLARAWGNDRFPAPEPWEEVCLAAEQHDVGMAEWERRPTIDPDTGLPRSFMELTLDEHLEIWWRAAPLVVSQSRYAALLVSMHGTALYERRNLDRLSPADRARVHEFLEGQRRLQERLLESLRADPATAAAAADDVVRRNQRLVWTWDSLSLGLLLDWAPFELDAVGITVEAGTLDPWPFEVPTLTFRCEGRRLEGSYDEDAPWTTIEITLSRAA
jgi:hypothetical protein